MHSCNIKKNDVTAAISSSDCKIEINFLSMSLTSVIHIDGKTAVIYKFQLIGFNKICGIEGKRLPIRIMAWSEDQRVVRTAAKFFSVVEKVRHFKKVIFILKFGDSLEVHRDNIKIKI